MSSDLDFPLLAPASTQPRAAPKRPTVSASSLLAISKAASLSTNPYKTLSSPIDRIIGPFLRHGYGLQISGPPGTYVEQLVLGLVKSVTSAGKGVLLVDMQNKIKADVINDALGGDARAERVHYCMLHKLPDVAELLESLPTILAEHPNISLLVLSSLSFPFHAETSYSTRSSLLDRIRESIIKLCKQHELMAVITSTMSTHFVHRDGSRGTFGNDTVGMMSPQIGKIATIMSHCFPHLHCKSISSLILSRDDRKSGRALFKPATKQVTLHAEFDFVDLELRDKVP